MAQQCKDRCTIMQNLHYVDHNEPQVPALNIRIFHQKCRLRWEMPHGQPMAMGSNWSFGIGKWSRISVLQNTGEFFILHTKREWKKFCIHEERRIATARFRVKNNIKQHQWILHRRDTRLMDILFYADWIWLSCIVRLPFNHYHRMAFPGESRGNFFQRQFDQHVFLSFWSYPFDQSWLLVLSPSS